MYTFLIFFAVLPMTFLGHRTYLCYIPWHHTKIKQNDLVFSFNLKLKLKRNCHDHGEKSFEDKSKSHKEKLKKTNKQMEKMNLRHERNICAWFNLQNFQKITGNYHNSYAPQSFQDMIKVTCKAIYFKIFRMLNVINKRARTAVVVAVAVAAKLNNMKVRTKLKLIYTFFL